VSAPGGVGDDPDRIVHPPQRQVALGEGLAPGPGIEEEPFLARPLGVGEPQVLLQHGDQLHVVVTRLVNPLHHRVDTPFQR